MEEAKTARKAERQSPGVSHSGNARELFVLMTDKQGAWRTCSGASHLRQLAVTAMVLEEGGLDLHVWASFLDVLERARLAKKSLEKSDTVGESRAGEEEGQQYFRA